MTKKKITNFLKWYHNNKDNLNEAIAEQLADKNCEHPEAKIWFHGLDKYCQKCNKWFK